MSEPIKSAQPHGKTSGDRVHMLKVMSPDDALDPTFDEVPGLTDEDREDIRDARLAMKDEGFVTLKELEAELGD